MADRSALESAAAAGIIRADQVGPLYSFLATGGVASVPPGEEDLRFIRNFHDVFLAIGIVLFAVGLAVGIGVFASGSATPQQGTLFAGGLCLTAAVVMWGLGELFARRRRLFLPAIAIVCALTAFTVIGAALLYAGALLGRQLEIDFGSGEMPIEVRAGLLLAAACAFIAPAAFYARFRLPFSLGLAGGGVAFFVIVASLIYNASLTIQYLPTLYLALGLLLFVSGVVFDARDPARVSRFSDNGFWLHFAAAPLVLSGSFGLVAQAFGAQGAEAMAGAGRLIAAGPDNDAAVAQAALTLLVVVLLGFVSLLINRRVLIVSALLTTGIAIAVILNNFGLGAGALAASVLVVLGGFVLVLGAAWHSVRRGLLGWVTPEGGWARIFPPESARE